MRRDREAINLARAASQHIKKPAQQFYVGLIPGLQFLFKSVCVFEHNLVLLLSLSSLSYVKYCVDKFCVMRAESEEIQI